MTSYTVLNRHGSVQERGCTLAEAAQIVLGYDGHDYDIRPDSSSGFRGLSGPDDERDFRHWTLWTSSFSRNSSAYKGLTESVIFALASSREEAEADIYKQVVAHADWWEGCEVMTDSDYDAMVAELAEEEDE